MKIAIVFGGKSYEHEISIVSSIALKDVISKELVFIFLDENRQFYHIPSQKMNSKLFSSRAYEKCDKLYLEKKAFYKKGTLLSKKVKIDFDIALSLMHGADGEDGLLSSLFDFYEIAFIAPRIEACVVSFNKFLTKSYAASMQVKTLDYKYFTKNDKVEIDTFPVIIKPVKLGSSIGVSLVKIKEELAYALDVAFEFDDAIIIEPFIQGVKEYNLAGVKINDDFVFSIIEEPSKAEFLDFDKKYLDFSRTSKVKEISLNEDLEFKIKDSFKKLYNTIFEGSLIRCDFFVIDDEVYLNEINPIPGSMANYLFDDFNSVLNGLCNSLPIKRDIKVSYDYVNKIQANKGK